MAKWLRKWFSGWQRQPVRENGEDSGSGDSDGSAFNLPEDGSADDSMSAPDKRWTGKVSTTSFWTNDSDASIAPSEPCHGLELCDQQSFESPSGRGDFYLEVIDGAVDSQRCSSIYSTPMADINIREVVPRGNVSGMEDYVEDRVPETSSVPRRTVTDRLEAKLPDRSAVGTDLPKPGTSSLNFVGKCVTFRDTSARIPCSSSSDDISKSPVDVSAELDWENEGQDAGGRRARASCKNGHPDNSGGSPRNLRCSRCLTSLNSKFFLSRHMKFQPKYCKKIQNRLSGEAKTSSTTASLWQPKKNLVHDFASAEGGPSHQERSSSQGTSGGLNPGCGVNHKKTRNVSVTRVEGARKSAARMLTRFKSQPSLAKQPVVKSVMAPRVGTSKSQAVKDQPVDTPLKSENRGGANMRKLY